MSVRPRNPSHERWQRVFLLFCLCGLLLLAVGWLAIGVGRELRDNLERAQQIEQSGNQVRLLQQTMVDLESGQRGYLLTGDPAYLQPYDAARQNLPALQGQLRDRNADDPEARALLDQIAHLTQAKASELEQALALQREQGRDAALEFMRTDVGMNLMQQIRELSEQLISLQQRQLAELRLAIPALVQQRDTNLLVLVVLGLLSGLAAFWSLRRHLVLLRREVELREAASQAIRESSEKSLFLANLSHEIRTPMNAIFGFTQLLEELVEGERPRFYVQAIQNSGKALLDLINDILDISKIEAGKLDVRPLPTDLRELFGLLNTVFAQMAMEKGLKLQLSLDPRLPRALLIDPTRLRQVLFNLVGNAIRYTDQGSVEVRIKVADSSAEESCVHCQIEVHDTGIGIADTDRERIFEPFTQLDDGGQGRRGGTGLGLAIVTRLVQLMQGQIEVESTPGEGSVFRLHFPRLQVSDQAPAKQLIEGRLEDLPPLKIVAVDDVSLNRELLDHLFEQTPHQLMLAAGGAEGVALVTAERPDLVLMDIRMPGMDGREALQRIRANPELTDVVVVAVTASSLLDEEHTLRSLFDGYVRKPITRQALFAELARLFGQNGGADPATPEAGAAATLAEHQAALSALTPDQRQSLESDLSALQQALSRAIATQASNDVAMVVQSARKLAQLLDAPQLQQLAGQIEAAATLFDLDGLGQRLDALALRLPSLQQRLAETGS